MIRKCLAVGIILLFIGTAIIPSSGQKIEKLSSPVSRDHWLYVGGSGPGNYTRIQDAINASSNGDTVFVYDDSSPYYEIISLDKSIALMGEYRNTTIIDGSGYHYIINVTSDNVTIYNFTIQNKGYNRTFNAMQILGNRCTILKNNIIRNGVGIDLSNSNRSNITDNYIVSDDENIEIKYSLNIHIQGNTLVEKYNDTIPNLPAGISISNSKQNIIMNNTLYNHSFRGIAIDGSQDNIILGNVFYNDSTGIALGSGDTLIQSNIIRLGYYGIFLLFTSNNYIVDNDITDCHYGIEAQASNQNYIFNNSITLNKGYGIDFLGSEENFVYQNIIKDNCYGLFIPHKSNGNVIYYNSFINNEFQAYDACNNIWNCSYPSAGNYWSDYIGEDVQWGENQSFHGSDGVGDTPYNISGGENRDQYPLMSPYGMTQLAIIIHQNLFQPSMTLKNVGNTTAFNIQWSIPFKGRFIILGRNSSGGVPKPLLPGQEVIVSSRYFLVGFGRVEMTFTAWADNAPIISTKINGILLLFFFFIR